MLKLRVAYTKNHRVRICGHMARTHDNFATATGALIDTYDAPHAALPRSLHMSLIACSPPHLPPREQAYLVTPQLSGFYRARRMKR
jgi:hypothetical protein